MNERGAVQEEQLRRRQAALVLSGGGALGAAHIGVLRQVAPRYDFEMYCGVSAGAIIASALACGHSVDQVSKILHDQKFFSLAFDFSRSSFGLIKGKRILNVLRRIYDDRKFSDLPATIKLAVGATDFSTGDRVFLESGNIAEAVRASLSVPVLFEPTFLDNRWLVDGGLTGNLPLDYALAHYHRGKIVAVDVCSAFDRTQMFDRRKLRGKARSMKAMIERTVRIVFFHQHRAYAHDPRIVLFRPELSEFASHDIRELKAIEKAGELYAKAVLEPLP